MFGGGGGGVGVDGGPSSDNFVSLSIILNAAPVQDDALCIT